MGPTPSLATYQAAANAIYEPQKAADITTAQNTTATQVANQEALKPQIQTDYQSAIDKLTAATNSNVAKINQLYTQRLGGNFSGLQGNDLGGMFGKAAQAQGVIESTRANKLAAIATTEANLKNTLASTIASLGSKYQGLEANYANSNYDAAIKAYNTNQIALQRLAISAAKASRPSQSSVDAANLAALNNAALAAFTAKGAQGKDSYVSPTTYNSILRTYESQGGTAAQFKAAFAGFANPNQKNINPNDLYIGF